MILTKQVSFIIDQLWRGRFHVSKLELNDVGNCMETLSRNQIRKLKWKLKLNQSGNKIMVNIAVTTRVVLTSLKIRLFAKITLSWRSYQMLSQTWLY